MLVLLIRTVLLFFVVVAAMRIMGKRTMGELQASEIVTILLISDIAAVPMQEIGIPLLAGVLPITVLVVLEVLVSCLMLKFAAFGRMVNGHPIIVVVDGKPDKSALKKLRMTNEDLFEALRKSGVFDIEQVKYAVVETDGKLSVLRRSDEMPPSAKDMNIKVPDAPMRVLVVSDGDIDRQSMKLIGWTENTIEKILRRNKIEKKDVYMLTGTEDGSYKIICEDHKIKNGEVGNK